MKQVPAFLAVSPFLTASSVNQSTNAQDVTKWLIESQYLENAYACRNISKTKINFALNVEWRIAKLVKMFRNV